MESPICGIRWQWGTVGFMLIIIRVRASLDDLLFVII